jgi:hypothetical protein
MRTACPHRCPHDGRAARHVQVGISRSKIALTRPTSATRTPTPTHDELLPDSPHDAEACSVHGQCALQTASRRLPTAPTGHYRWLRLAAMEDWLAPLSRDFKRPLGVADTLSDVDKSIRIAVPNSVSILEAWEFLRDASVRLLAHGRSGHVTEDRLLLTCGGLDVLLIAMRGACDRRSHDRVGSSVRSLRGQLLGEVVHRRERRGGTAAVDPPPDPHGSTSV